MWVLMDKGDEEARGGEPDRPHAPWTERNGRGAAVKQQREELRCLKGKRNVRGEEIPRHPGERSSRQSQS